MIINVFLLLVLLGLGSFLFRDSKYSRFVSFGLFTLTTVVFANFAYHWYHGTTVPFIFHWIQYKTLHIDIGLSSNLRNYIKIFPLFLILLVSLLNNTFAKQESQRVRLGGQMCLNLAFLILLICTNNLIVMMISSFLVGFIGIYIINDYEIKKNYIFYNLISDMAMFSAFALVYGQFNQVQLSVLTKYGASGEHLTLVTCLLLFSLFIKNGLFLFQNQLLCFRDLSFNRLIFLNFSGIPICGIIIYGKIFGLLLNFEYSQYIIGFFVISSALYGLIGSLVYDDIKEKALSLNMLFWSFFYGLSLYSPKFAFIDYAQMFLLWYCLNLLIYTIVISASNEIYVSKMGGFMRSLWPEFVLFLFWVFALAQNLLLPDVPISAPAYWIWGFAVFTGIALAHFLRGVFFGSCRAANMVSAFLKLANPIFFLAPLGIIGYQIYTNSSYSSPILWAYTGITLLLVAIYPFRRLACLYDNDELQMSEFFRRFYEIILLAPITIVGRILWLTVDFVIIERTIINSISSFTRFLIGISQKIHRPSLLNYILLTALGLGIMFFYIRG